MLKSFIANLHPSFFDRPEDGNMNLPAMLKLAKNNMVSCLIVYQAYIHTEQKHSIKIHIYAEDNPDKILNTEKIWDDISTIADNYNHMTQFHGYFSLNIPVKEKYKVQTISLAMEVDGEIVDRKSTSFLIESEATNND